MGKAYPITDYIEQIQIYKLCKAYKGFSVLFEEEERDMLRNDVKKAKQNSMVALRIPLLKFADIREKLSLSDYIIYLIIFEFNTQGKFFIENNDYFVNLTGIKISQIEKSLKTLLKLEMIMYVDENGKMTSEKPLTKKQYQEWKLKLEDENLEIPVNEKRVFIVNYEKLEFCKKNIPLTKEERLKTKQVERIKRAKMKEIENKFIKTLQILKISFGIDDEMMKKAYDTDFQCFDALTRGKVEGVLTASNLRIKQLVRYIDFRNKNKE